MEVRLEVVRVEIVRVEVEEEVVGVEVGVEIENYRGPGCPFRPKDHVRVSFANLNMHL